MKACKFNKEEAPAKVFYCKFCKTFKNTLHYRTPLVAASAFEKLYR